MPVYTTIETGKLEGFLSGYSVGALRDFEGISDGIENTHYFVNTDNVDSGRFVLTLFEHHTLEEMQYYLGLMHYLADHKHFPRPGELIHTKVPDEFRAILKDRVANTEMYRGYWI
jgi:Ser/Thr protein kinase RdoA (MazF antagonist)